MSGPPPPPPPPGGIMVKKIPLSEDFPSTTPHKNPGPPGQGAPMGALMQELSRALGTPKQYQPQDTQAPYQLPPSQTSPKSPSSPSPQPPKKTWERPAQTIQQENQSEELVFYHVKGPTVAKIQSLVTFQLTCRNKSKELVDIDTQRLEAFIVEEKTGEESKGIISVVSKGVFQVKVRGKVIGSHVVNVYVVSGGSGQAIFENGVPLLVIIEDPVVQENINFTASGLHGGLIGKQYQFQVDTKADDGSNIDVHVDRLLLEISQGLKKTKGNIEQIGKGQYLVSFYPFNSGDLVLKLSYGKYPVIETTLTFDASIDPSQTIILDPLCNALVGKQNTFTIQARGEDGRDLTTGGVKFEVACAGPPGGISGLVVRDELTGKYTVRFTLLKSGTYKILISLSKQPIQGSPLTIEAR
eukprot:TRINITY_DN3317_c0_g1_i3.p1 TRINITY_DN3317_c0_g1~~TRINITY_DN3317_c0_g1_i3.p1  ORF type:complete len:412 (+),score=90.08 TRINITY_DN3317_c0_g1_i3:63-1298(+)